MANYYGSARTNYFKVKDLARFKAELDGLCDIVERQDGTVGLFPGGRTDSGHFPEFDDDDEPFDFAEEVAKHLAEGWVLVLMQNGAEKLRYLDGYAVAINHRLDRIEINISTIEELARAAWPGANVTDCTY